MIPPRPPILSKVVRRARASATTLIDLALFLALGISVVLPWTRHGWLLLLDWTSGPNATLSNSAFGLDSGQADAMPARLLLQILRHLVGARPASWLPILAVFPIAGVGAARLVGGRWWRRWATGLAFTVNPFVFERLRAGHVWLLLGAALLPWALSSFLAARRESRWFRVRTAAWLAVLVSISPHLFWIGGLLLLATTLVPRPAGRDLVRLVATIVAAAGVAAYGIAVYMAGSHTVSVSDADLTVFATKGQGPFGKLLEVLTLDGFWRTTPGLARDTRPLLWLAGLAALAALAAVGLARTWRDDRAAPLVRPVVAAGAFAALLAGGAGGLLGPAYALAVRHLPLFAVMREAQKFAVVVALAGAILIGHGVDAAVEAAAGSRVAKLAPALAALPILMVPNLALGLGGSVPLSNYPTSWAAAEAIMGPGDGAVLVLPWHQYQPYTFSGGRSVRTPAAAYFSRQVVDSDATELPGLRNASTSTRSRYLDQVMARLDGLHHLGRLVAPLGVEYVLATTTAAAAELPPALDHQMDLEEVLRTDDLVLYRNTVTGTGRVGTSRTVRSFDDLVQLAERGQLGTEAVFLDPTAPETPITPSTSSGGLHTVSPVAFQLDGGDPGLVVVPAIGSTGWKLGGQGGRETISGAVAIPSDGAATRVVYAPWRTVRQGYLLSAAVLFALFAAGLAEHRHDLAASRVMRALRRRGRRFVVRFRTGNGPAYAGAWLVAAVAVNTWFDRGRFVATGDMAPFIRRGWMDEATWSWSHAITGGGSATYVIARWYEFVLVRVVHQLGGSDTLAQRFFYMSIYPLVALGVASVAAVFTKNRIAIFAAGVFGVFNGFFLTRLPNPLNVISVASTALMAGVLFRVAKGRKLPALLMGLAMLPMSFLAYNPPMLVVALAWTALGLPVVVAILFGTRALGRVIKYQIMAAPWALALNVFWLVPFAQAFTGGGSATATAQTDATAWAWSQAQNSVPNVLTMSANWAWYKPQYLPFTPALDQWWWIGLRYLLPFVVFLAPVLARPRKRRMAIGLLFLVIVFTVLAKGLQPPFTGFNQLLYAKVPGFWLFREPMSKLGQLLIVFNGALLALTIDGVAARAHRHPIHLRRGLRIGLAMSVGAVIVWPYPLFNGAVIPDVRPKQPSAHVEVPSYWRATAALIDSDPAPGKVLVLPLDDYYQMPTIWGFSGADNIAGLLFQHPVLQRHPDGYFGDAPGLAAQIDQVEAALVAGDLAAVAPLLENIGVTWIVVRHDLITGDPTRTFADSDILSAALTRLEGMERIQDGTLEVYRTAAGASPTVRSAGTPLVLPESPDALAQAVASVAAGTGIVGDADHPVAAAPAGSNVESPDALSSADGAYWAVPASDSPVTSTTFESTGGTFDVNQRARAKPTLVPVEVTDASSPSGAALELRDPARVLVDGEVVSERPATRYPVSRAGVVAVTAGDRTVSLDRWTAASLPAGSSGSDPSAAGPTVVIGAATPLTAWASAGAAEVAMSTDVYDCNNYEPRPIAELGLAASVDAAGVTTLRASDHAACVAESIAGVSGGDTLRVRIEYRTEAGKRPQVCLLEMLTDGTDRCVPDARMRRSGDWNRYELVHTLAPDVVEAKIVLYANVGLRLLGETVSQYRGLTVERLESVLDTTAWPAAVPTTQVELEAGTHTMSVEGGAYGSMLTTFDSLEDCFRYDDQTIDEAGLEATALVSEEGPSFELRAVDHMACLASTMPDASGFGLSTLSYGYRSVALRKPKICLYHLGPNICEPLPANGAETEWATYERELRPYVASLETRLYLYGPRDLAGASQAIVQFRGVAVRPNAATTAVVLTRAAPEPPTTSLDWMRTTPASFRVGIPAGVDHVVVGLAETAAPGWLLTGLPEGATARKVRLGGYMNGWIVEGLRGRAADVRVIYPPAFTAHTALKISAMGVVGVPMWLLVRLPFHRSRQRRRQRRQLRRRIRRHPVPVCLA